jgi:hypothetical protein
MVVSFWTIALARRNSCMPASGANMAGGAFTRFWWRNISRIGNCPVPPSSISTVFQGLSGWWSMLRMQEELANELRIALHGISSLKVFTRNGHLASPFPVRLRWMRCSELRSRLAAAYGTFVRVDLYQSSKGIYFGEFSSTPFNGTHIQPWADHLLGQMWQEHCPQSI